MIESFLLLQDGVNYLLLQNGNDSLLLQESTLMCDQVEIQIPQTIVYEETSFVVTAYFRNRAAKTPCTPTTIHYRLDCLTTGREILDWTSVSPPAGSNTITITSAQNQILDDSYDLETKQITVKLDNGLSTQIIKPAQWKIRNLKGIPR